MAAPGLVSNFYVQQGNRQVYLSWDITAGATSYSIQKSTDGVNFTVLATPTATTLIDAAVSVGTMYYYNIAAVNGASVGIYSPTQKIVPAPAAEMSLFQIREMAQQRADRVDSNFVTLPEWNNYINQAAYELYDLLITIDEEYFIADPIQFQSVPNQSVYPLPDGQRVYTNGNTGDTNYVAPPFYKFKGQDLGLNTASNAFVTVNKFTFMDRNRYVFPNTASTLYGVFNLQYRLQGIDKVKFIPTPSSGQNLQMWYIPRLPQLVADTDLTNIGISGWLQYVIVRAAKYALDKEESNTDKLDSELIFLKQRIEETSANRDTAQPDRITDVRQNWSWGNQGGGWNGPVGGWAVLPLGLMPQQSIHNSADKLLANFIHFSEFGLAKAACCIYVAYFFYLLLRKFSSGIFFSDIRNFFARRSSTFSHHISHIVGISSKKQMHGIDTLPVVASVADTQRINNRTIVNFPTQSVGFNLNLSCLSTRSHASSWIDNCKNAITRIYNLASPFPATIRRFFINFRPKSVFKHSLTISTIKSDCQ